VFKKRIGKEKKGCGKKFSKRDYLLLLILTLSLAGFFHFREVRFFIFELNSVAPHDIVAIQDFSYLDKKQMIVLRQEALVDLGKIWRIKEGDIKHVEGDFLRQLSNHPNWRSTYPVTYNEMVDLSKDLFQEMENWHFTDKRTYKKREEIGEKVGQYSLVEGVVFNKPLILPNDFWKKIEQRVGEDNSAYIKEIAFIISSIKGYKFHLERDHDERLVMEKNIFTTIPEIYSFRSQHEMIVKKGDVITQREYDQILAMKEALKKSRNLLSPLKILSSLLLAMLVVFLGGMFFYMKHQKVLKSTNTLALYIVLILVTCGIAKGIELILNSTPYPIASLFQFPIIIPFMSILLAIFLNESIALFTSLFLTVLIGFTLAVSHNHFIIINVFAGIVASLSAAKMKKRKEIFFVCFKVWAVCSFAMLIYLLSINRLFNETALLQLAAFAMNIIVIAVLLIVVIPIIELVFHIMTNIALVEYIDPTHPLLQRLSLEAPGTYQHSLSIGHIAEYAANAIGANGMLCRVTTLYHDVGKLNNPHYYTENQLMTGQRPFNIHQLLTPIESAYIIKSHILDGVALAKQYKLPKIFIDIILEHHGTTLIKFFYLEQLKKMNGIEKDVDDKAFRYPGPKPQTKESAIIMLADSVEAASRTLEENSEEVVQKLVERITSSKILDNQFDECNLTFDELSIVKQKLVEIIKATHHLRIKYPEEPQYRK